MRTHREFRIGERVTIIIGGLKHHGRVTEFRPDGMIGVAVSDGMVTVYRRPSSVSSLEDDS